jgi:sphingosine kinase
VYIEDQDPVKPKILILLNPFGGAGAARINWQQVEPMMDKAHIDYTLQETEFAGHAYEIVNSGIVAGMYDAIVTVSGDGLIHEVINGLLNRKDWDSKTIVENMGEVKFRETLTVGSIPGGTGNGFMKSLLEKGNENYGIFEAAFRVIKGRKIEVDLTEFTLEYEPNKKIYSFLSFAWAVFADIDISSEAIRCCGPTRFTVWGVYRTLFLRDYFGSLRYIGSRARPQAVL